LGCSWGMGGGCWNGIVPLYLDEKVAVFEGKTSPSVAKGNLFNWARFNFSSLYLIKNSQDNSNKWLQFICGLDFSSCESTKSTDAISLQSPEKKLKIFVGINFIVVTNDDFFKLLSFSLRNCLKCFENVIYSQTPLQDPFL